MNNSGIFSVVAVSVILIAAFFVYESEANRVFVTRVPIVATQANTLTSETTSVIASIYTTTRQKIITSDHVIGIIPFTVLGRQVEQGLSLKCLSTCEMSRHYDLSPGTFFVSIKTNGSIGVMIFNSRLWKELQNGQVVSVCMRVDCNLIQNGAQRTCLSAGTIYFEIPKTDTYYLLFSSDSCVSNTIPSTTLSGEVGMVVQQTTSYSTIVTSFSTTTNIETFVTTMYSTTYTNSTMRG